MDEVVKKGLMKLPNGYSNDLEFKPCLRFLVCIWSCSAVWALYAYQRTSRQAVGLRIPTLIATILPRTKAVNKSPSGQANLLGCGAHVTIVLVYSAFRH